MANIDPWIAEVRSAARLAALERARKIAQEHNLTVGLHGRILEAAQSPDLLDSLLPKDDQ